MTAMKDVDSDEAKILSVVSVDFPICCPFLP
jgi:hypothetical protein